MLYRHSMLVLKHIPSHPQYKDPEYRKPFKVLSQRVNSVLADLESLKPEIEKVYKEWEESKPTEAPNEPNTNGPGTYADFASRDPSLGGYTQVLDASENQELAVDLAQKELRRRETVRRATKQAGISDRETSARRRGGLWDSVGPQASIHAEDSFDLQRQLEATRRTLDRPASSGPPPNSIHEPGSWPTTTAYQYPSLARPRPLDERRDDLDAPAPSLPPAIPAKDQFPLARFETPPLPPKPAYGTEQPSVPSKVPLSTPQTQYQEPSASASAASPSRKDRLTFRPGAYLENGEPIRSVFLPSKLRSEFLQVAAENTRQGLETCGILCGMPINNALFVRCLLIPDQKSTPDTCETQNESAMFDYCDKEDLLMIGWIHTHPTQTCFMSSRDLHTHAGYQIMMPESIAIVCAPKFTPS